MKQEQVKELVLQALEHERGGIEVYRTALECAVNDDLREEWQEYLQQTETHVEVLETRCGELEIDPEEQSPGRAIVQALGEALVRALDDARENADEGAAQLVACECVVLAETKDHLDWELLSQVAEGAKGAQAKAIRTACEAVEDEEDEHLYHTKGWCRELWIESLGMKAVLPPPEEKKNVKTASGAARAKQSRAQMQ
jgi:rubrerythrin